MHVQQKCTNTRKHTSADNYLKTKNSRIPENVGKMYNTLSKAAWNCTCISYFPLQTSKIWVPENVRIPEIECKNVLPSKNAQLAETAHVHQCENLQLRL